MNNNLSDYNPTTLKEAIDVLLAITTEQDRDSINDTIEWSFLMHHYLGRDLRNGWNLWNDGPLVSHFNEMGIAHPDDMSGLILWVLECEVKGLNFDINQRISEIQSFYA